MKQQCTKAVIIAAGCGSRVRAITPDRPKCLMDLGGRPIIKWILNAVEMAGIDEVVIVTGFRPEGIKRVVGRRSGRIRITYVHNPKWRLPNGLSLYAARRAVRCDEAFILLMSDHLLPAAVIKKVARAGTSKCVLAVDTNPSRVFDLGDATKVRVIAGNPVAINKRLRKYNAVDCGLFRFDRRVFAALEASFEEGVFSLTGGVKKLVASGDLEVLPIGKGTFWLDIDTPRAYRQALKHLASFRSDCNQRRSRRHGRKDG